VRRRRCDGVLPRFTTKLISLRLLIASEEINWVEASTIQRQ
jgi:hypothetical protein